MSEASLVARTETPKTRASLAEDLHEIGVRAGQVVVLHSSLKAIGWVAGGPVAVLLAFQDVLTEAGTLMVPTHTSDRTDPAGWRSPPVPVDWVPIIRQSVPAFDPALTPSRDMGIIAETLRTWPKVHRSQHPHVSFAAWGHLAEEITSNHALAWSMGEGSPLARAYSAGAMTLLLGTRNCTSLHLAEVFSGTASRCTQAAAVYQDGVRAWAEFPDWIYCTEQFPEVLDAFCVMEGIRPGKVGDAETLLLDQRALVDYATDFFRHHPRNELA